MKRYAPPFSIPNDTLSRVARIAEKIGKAGEYRAFETKPYLRRNNRIRSVHSSLLAEWRPIFRYLPLESRIQAFQEEYYRAIAVCHADAFLLFMLDMIDQTPDWALRQLSEMDAFLPTQVQRLLEVMEYDVPYTRAQLMEKLSLKPGTASENAIECPRWNGSSLSWASRIGLPTETRRI